MRSLARLVLGRLWQGALLLLALSFLLFGLMAHLPGDPVDLLVASNPELRSEDITRLKKLRGLDQPFTVRWWRWLVGYHEAIAPPAARTLPPVFGETDRNDDGRPRSFALRLPVDGLMDDLVRLGLSIEAAPPATIEGQGANAVVTAVLDEGAHLLTIVVTDRHAQQAPWTVAVFVAPARPDTDRAPRHDDPVVIDESDPQLAGGTEVPRPERRSNLEVQQAAIAVHPLPPPPRTVDSSVDSSAIDPVKSGVATEVVSQRVLVNGDTGAVTVVSGVPVVDPDHFVCGIACVVTGDLSGLGWSFATKRPVAELLFGKAAACGDALTDPSEGCDDGNVEDGDGCDGRCLPEGATWMQRVDIAVAGWLTGPGRIGNTLLLTVPSLLLAMMLAMVLGTAAGLRGGAVDVVVRAGAAVFSAMPAFLVGLLLVTVFAERWRVLPSGGIFQPGIQQEGAVAVVVDRLRHGVLPCTVLVLFWSGRFVRQVRSAVIAAAAGEFVRTARMKGASTSRIIWRHILPNAAVPLFTLVGLSLPALFGGALLTETVFAWPGLGRLQYDAILQNDSYVAVVVLLLSAAMVLVGSLIADVLVALVDPRQRLRRRR